MAVNGGHAGTKKVPNWGHVKIDFFQSLGPWVTLVWRRGSTGVERYGCIPQSGANNLGEIPQKTGAPNPLFLKSFSGERTLWDSSLPIALTLWDTPVLCTPPLPLSQLVLMKSETPRSRKASPDMNGEGSSSFL